MRRFLERADLEAEIKELRGKIMDETSHSPFRKAEPSERRLRLFLWGDTGSGKTTFALRFPSPAVIDMEGGTDHYADSFHFHRVRTTSAQEAVEAIDWLLTQQHPYRTLVIDPITILWEALQKKWSDIFLVRNKGKKSFKHEFYLNDWQDWATVKSDLREIMRKILACDMSVVVTARQKLLYPEDGARGNAVEVFDGEKTLPYLFDTILHLYRRDGKFLAFPIKDRTGKLPATEFELDYKVFSDAFGAGLNRAAEPVRLVTPEQILQLRDLIKYAGLSDDQVATRLESYGAESIADLTEGNAALIIRKLEAFFSKKGVTTHAGH